MKSKQQNHQKGILGEDIAANFLVKNGFTILARNYAKKWGELDIVASKTGTLNFIEVKSVSKNIKDSVYKPEDNVNAFKIKQIRRMISTYMDEMGRGLDEDFRFHVICVYMDFTTRKASIRWIKDVIL